MADYFGREYASLVDSKGLPSPADTPYETPSFIRSKRSSRATVASSSRDHSRSQTPSPPPLPPDTNGLQEPSRDGSRFGNLDPRRFTPTLHASLVSEILSLRRELDSKNALVENLESSLAETKTENEDLTERLTVSNRDVNKSRAMVAQLETGTLEAVEQLAKERDLAQANADELRTKLDTIQRKTRLQDDDAERTQTIWQDQKEEWDKERIQLERRVHVTEARLRTVIEEMAAQQAVQAQQLQQQQSHSRLGPIDQDEGTFKDSGLGNESDTASVRSTTSPIKHRRNLSNLSDTSGRLSRNKHTSLLSRSNVDTPEPVVKPGHSLADELGIDEEDEYDIDEFEHPDDDEMLDYHAVRQQMESRQSMAAADIEPKAKRVLGLSSEIPDSPVFRDAAKRSTESTRNEGTKISVEQASALLASANAKIAALELAQQAQVVYVDSGYQPSPPQSPPRASNIAAIVDSEPQAIATFTSTGKRSLVKQNIAVFESAPNGSMPSPAVPVAQAQAEEAIHTPAKPMPIYVTSATQTEIKNRLSLTRDTTNQNNLALFVPSIAIHPPSSRPTTPRQPVLPPGTKNASTQAEMTWPGVNAEMQTEEIRVDRRMAKLPLHLQPSSLLPSPTISDNRRSNRISNAPSMAKIDTDLPAVKSKAPHVQPLASPVESSPEISRDSSARDLRALPLKAIPLPRPVLSPVVSRGDIVSNGPLNRSSQYGVSQPKREHMTATSGEPWNELSDNDDDAAFSDYKDISSLNHAVSRPPHGRFGLSDPPKAVPEDKEVSPEARPKTAESYAAAPAPSIASSREHKTRQKGKQAASKEYRSRSPSFGSLTSNFSHPLSSSAAHNGPGIPPYPIPKRSSSRIYSKPLSEGSRSPTQHESSNHKSRRSSKAPSNPSNLRKVQSANAMRQSALKASPPKQRRRRRSPELTPVQSMAFESPAATKFPIPDLPEPSRSKLSKHGAKPSADLTATTTNGSYHNEEVNLVDAIAGTMVGEWMWKYIRKRKSFGIAEDNAEFPIQDEHGVVNITAHGTRHKRWVWLSPYERTIMWDNKQPTSGSALLGKKGRKLTIQSVLDVLDTTPLPKNPELESAWHRSILILTPERALKFTTVSAERHMLWMTALSFLAQSGNMPAATPQMSYKPPPVPTLAESSAQPSSPFFGRSNVRDSIRVAKNKRPDVQSAISSQAAASSSTSNRYSNSSAAPAPDILTGPVRDSYRSSNTSSDRTNDGADFPAVPRLYIGTTRHQRNRSNTSPRLPPALSTLRSFSSSVSPSIASSNLHPNHSQQNQAPPHPHHPPPPPPSSLPNSSSAHLYRSAASTSASASASLLTTSAAGPSAGIFGHTPNFFEAVGTVRMEAFVDPNVRDGVLYVPAPPPGIGGSAGGPAGGMEFGQGIGGIGGLNGTGGVVRRKRGDSSLSLREGERELRRAGYVFDEDGSDPFKGF